MTDRDLDRLWEARAAGETVPPERAAAIAKRLTADLKPVRPLPGAGYFAGAFALVAIAIAVAGGMGLGDYALLRMTGVMFAATFTALALSVALAASALSAQMAPASRQLARPWVVECAILFGLAVVFAALFTYREEPAFWMRAWRCLRTGLAGGAASSALLWLILRRGAMLDPRAGGALAGLLGGLTGTALLEIHCPDFNLAHILAGHWAAALVCSGLGWMAGGIAARRA